jgi:dihydropteroate synthase
MYWQTSRFHIDLARPQVMGIVNVTPDSFSDGGHFASRDAAVAHCDRLLKDGADLLDIGGESTRPGAPPVPLEEELARVLPVLRHAVTLGVPVSVDTYKPMVMQAALDLGVDIINDIWGLRWAGDAGGKTGAQVISAHPACGICVMHMHREPRTMQLAPMEGDVVAQVKMFLSALVSQIEALGVDAKRISIDPGIGFGKTVQQNFALLARQSELLPLGYPILAGWSRKSTLAAVTQTSLASVASMDVLERMVPSVAAAMLAVQNGASIVRVHDVRQTVQALKVLAATHSAGKPVG